MKKISTIKKMILLVILVLLLIYQIPASQKDFFKTYPKNDYAATTLKDFYNKKTKTVVVNDITWHYVSSGNSDKTILFLHGMGGAYDLWWQQVRAFEKNYKVISYTLPEKITTLEGALTGIKAILQNERVDTFTAVGTSMGGYIAQYLLKNMPERLEKIVFSNTFPPNEELRRENATKSKVIPLLPEVLVDYLGKKSIKNKLLPAAHNDTLLAAFLPSLPFSKKQFINRYYVVVDRFTFNPSSYNYKKVPKLIIESDNDPLISPQLRQAIKAQYPNAQVFTFHNEGHFPYINAANKYNEVLQAFLLEENTYLEIEKVVNMYFNGRKKADVNLLKNAFSPDARLQYADSHQNHRIVLDEYIKKVAKDGSRQIKTKILAMDYQGNMGWVKTQFSYPDKEYIDYLTLLKSNNQWKIMSKTFYRLP